MGLSRHGFSEDQIARIKDAYRILFRSKLGLNEAISKLRAEHGGNMRPRSTITAILFSALVLSGGMIGAACAQDCPRGDLDKTIEEYRTAIRLAPDEPLPYTNLAGMYTALNRPDEARRTIEDGIHTYDIYTERVSTQKAGTKEFAAAVIARLGQQPETLKL